MNITEEQKQEAERVLIQIKNIQVYISYKETDFNYRTVKGELTNSSVIKLAIQDRQSVLDYAIRKSNEKDRTYDKYEFSEDIQSLTNQIEYLKTKL